MPKGQPVPLSAEVRALALSWYREGGVRQRVIAAALGITQPRFNCLLKAAGLTGKGRPKRAGGRKRARRAPKAGQA